MIIRTFNWDQYTLRRAWNSTSCADWYAHITRYSIFTKRATIREAIIDECNFAQNDEASDAIYTGLLWNFTKVNVPHKPRRRSEK